MTQAVDELVNVLEEARVSRLVLVPTLLRAVLAHCSAPAAPKLPALRLWVCSGEVFPSDLLHSFFATFRNGQTICNFYGSTEVMGDVTFLQLHDASEASARLVKNKVPIGSPIDNNRIYFLNVDGEEVEEGSIGEVYVAGLNVAKGYVGGAQPDKFIINKYTEDPDYSVLYRTGDFARVVDGLLVFEGRADTQIKVRGHRVDMNEVEMVIKKIKGVNKVTVMCYNPGEVNQNLLAFYTSEVEALSPEEIKKEFATLLQPYMQPQVIRLDDLPLLVNGKVDRQHLLKMYKQQSGGNSSGVEIEVTGVREGAEEAAATSLLRTVARVLGPAVAKGTTLSLDTSFFDVGGNSLNSVLTVTSLQDLGYSVGIGDFMRASLLREVLNHMKKMSEYEKHRAAASPPACSAMNGGYQLCTLSQKHREAVISLIGESFSVKGDLERWLKTEPWEYKQLLEDVFDVLVEAEISLVYARKGTGEVVACCLNFDLRDEPQLENISPKLAYVLAFLESVESPSREGLPEGPGEVMHCFMMGTLISLGPAENVQLIQMMEQENLRMATRRGFKAVFTTNTSDLTQQVCDDLLSYTVLHDAQVNTWVAEDGTRPFSAAPDTQHAVCTVKFL